MVNKGIAPLDPDTKVGRLRALLRDTQYTELTPAEPGYGDYGLYSDLALEAYLIEAGDNPLRAAGRAVTALAIEYSAKGKSVKTDDLAVDLRSRGKDLLAVARSFLEDANAEDAAEASDYFNIVGTGRSCRDSGVCCGFC